MFYLHYCIYIYITYYTLCITVSYIILLLCINVSYIILLLDSCIIVSHSDIVIFYFCIEIIRYVIKFI